MCACWRVVCNGRQRHRGGRERAGIDRNRPALQNEAGPWCKEEKTGTGVEKEPPRQTKHGKSKWQVGAGVDRNRPAVHGGSEVGFKET